MDNVITQAPSLRATTQSLRLWDLSSVHRLLKILLWSGVALLALSIVSGWMEIQLLGRVMDGYDISASEAAASDSRQGMLGMAQIVLWVITGIVFLRFIYRACQNAHILTTSRVDFTPGWAVGWYFVPFANLIRPYQAMEQIYRVSEEPTTDLRRREPVGIINGWWALWIVSAFLGNYVLRTSWAAETTAEFYNASIATLISDVIDIPLYLVAIALVGRIFQMQMSREQGYIS